MRVRPSQHALRSFGRVAVLTFIGSLAAACSSDSSRLAENPFSNPFEARSQPGSDTMTTGSVGGMHPVPPADVTSAPLPAPQMAPQTAPIASPVRPAQVGSSGQGSAAPTYMGNASNWSPEGGTAVTLGQGETVLTLSNRYGVPPQAIMQANNLRVASDAHPGQRLVIPVYRAAGAPAQPLPPRPAPIVARQPAAKPHEVSRATHAPANKLAALKEKPKAAEHHVAAKAHVARVEPVKAAPAKVALAKVEPPKAEKPVIRETVAPAPVRKAESAPAPAKQDVETTASLPPANDAASEDFRWPARGRIISAYKRGGNEGINIALPEGSPVRSADGGVVAYAGNELKGYGNLVLIRHPNGYVTAYAHNGELMVKRGQNVSRGQVIAKSGATGNVASPQLHFELRKGATPVDPMPYLN